MMTTKNRREGERLNSLTSAVINDMQTDPERLMDLVNALVLIFVAMHDTTAALVTGVAYLAVIASGPLIRQYIDRHD